MTSYRARAAVGADAVTPATQAAGDGFVTYDELRGPDLDAGRWSPARLPLPPADHHGRLVVMATVAYAGDPRGRPAGAGAVAGAR